MSLGENIRERRKAVGITQESLGEKLGMVAQTVSKWERDESMPDAALLPKLADALSCSLDSLFDRPVTTVHDAAVGAKDWLLTLSGEDRWMGALRLGRIVQTVLAGFWELWEKYPDIHQTTVEEYDSLESYPQWGISTTGGHDSELGFTLSSRREAMPFLLLFPEPKAGWGPLLEEDNAAPYWEALAKEPVRRALKRLYEDNAFFRFDLDWAKENCGWDEDIVNSLMLLGAIGRERARINGQDSDLYYVRYGHLRLRLMTILLLASTRNEKQFGFDYYGRTITPFLRTKETGPREEN